jgi:hypothetical protein
MSAPMNASQGTEQRLREQAITRLRKRRDFRIHVRVYVIVNTMLVVIWVVTGGFFWPIFPILGWGIGGGCERLGRLWSQADR